MNLIWALVTFLAFVMLDTEALNSKAFCSKECAALVSPKDLEDVKALHKKVHSVCEKYFTQGAQVGHACREGYVEVGRTACTMACSLGLSGNAIRNSPEVASHIENCFARKKTGGTINEVNACKEGIAKGNIAFASIGKQLVESAISEDAEKARAKKAENQQHTPQTDSPTFSVPKLPEEEPIFPSKPEIVKPEVGKKKSSGAKQKPSTEQSKPVTKETEPKSDQNDLSTPAPANIEAEKARALAGEAKEHEHHNPLEKLEDIGRGLKSAFAKFTHAERKEPPK